MQGECRKSFGGWFEDQGWESIFAGGFEWFSFFWLLDFHLRRGSSEDLLRKDATRIKEFGGGVKSSSREGALSVQTQLLSRAATVTKGAAHGLIVFAPHNLNLGLWNGQQGGE